MRRWSRLSAYNAGQMMLVQGKPNLDLWRDAAEGVIAELGLGVPRFRKHDKVVEFSPPPPFSIQRVTSSLQSFANEELNRSFTSRELPIRFFVQERTDGTYYFGAFYDHWIADSYSMRELMRRIWERYNRIDLSGQTQGMTRQAASFSSLFRDRIGLLSESAIAKGVNRFLARHVGAFSIELRDRLDFNANFLHANFPAGLITNVLEKAKNNEASVNDVFLAALGQAMKATCSDRRKGNDRYDRLSIGTIVDIRDSAQEPLDNVFGLYLSGYLTVLDKPDKQSLNSLIRTIANRKRRREKETFDVVRAYSGFAMAHFTKECWNKEKYLAALEKKNVPVVAGISNVNLTNEWMDQLPNHNDDKQLAVLDYLRISPVGPLPLVFTLTTLRDQLSVCVTYRTTAFKRDQVESIVSRFADKLASVDEQ